MDQRIADYLVARNGNPDDKRDVAWACGQLGLPVPADAAKAKADSIAAAISHQRRMGRGSLIA